MPCVLAFPSDSLRARMTLSPSCPLPGIPPLLGDLPFETIFSARLADRSDGLSSRWRYDLPCNRSRGLPGRLKAAGRNGRT